MTSKHPALRDWEEGELKKTLARSPERQQKFTRPGGGEVPRLAVPEKISDEYLTEIGFPGRYPYTRGVQPTMYRGRLWTMRQYAGFSTASESNQRYRYLLEQGQTGLSVAFDLPTQIGYDSDHPMSLGEVGRVGVAIDTLADMEILFDQIPLGNISTSMTINSPAMILLAMYVAVAEKQGIGPERLQGTIQNDILKEYVARGTYIFPPRPSLRLITDIFRWCAARAPQFNTISISGYHIREAGSTAAQEIAFTLANGITYVQAALDAGLELEVFARRLAFFFNASSNLLEEVAKFRAARRLWARIMRERFEAVKPGRDHAALPHPDRRQQPDRPADRQQHRPGDHPGPGRGPGRHPVPAHQLPRRGPGPAHRGGGAHRPSHPADHRLRIRGCGFG